MRKENNVNSTTIMRCDLCLCSLDSSVHKEVLLTQSGISEVVFSRNSVLVPEIAREDLEEIAKEDNWRLGTARGQKDNSAGNGINIGHRVHRDILSIFLFCFERTWSNSSF